jgi:predicted RNA-binding Zn-ribbon protein involved in translation (DUF1610 family)
MRRPESMEECVYFTNRTLENGGKIMAWVFRKECPKCKKAQMGKPVVKGKVKSRAKEYVCPGCGYIEEKMAHEKTLTVNIEYTCPFCRKSGEATTPYVRKTFNGVPSYVFVCAHCGEKVGITKKMKKPKVKK